MLNSKFLIPLFTTVFLSQLLSSAFSLDKNGVVLTVKNTSNTVIMQYSMTDLALQFPHHRIKTQTPWTNGKDRVYRGAPLLDILKQCGIENATSIEGLAQNEFSAKISIADVKSFNPIIATEVACTTIEAETGKCNKGSFRPLTIQDFGPLFVVWPFDAMPSSADPHDHSHWIWFVNEIHEI